MSAEKIKKFAEDIKESWIKDIDDVNQLCDMLIDAVEGLERIENVNFHNPEMDSSDRIEEAQATLSKLAEGLE